MLEQIGQNQQEHKPDPIDLGLDRMHRVIESQIDPMHAQARQEASDHLAELKALRATRDSRPRAEAIANASQEAESSADAQKLIGLEQEQARIKQEIESITQEMQKLGTELKKYMSRDEAIPYITGQKSIGASKKLGALFLGRIGHSNIIIGKLRELHIARENLRGRNAELAKEIGRQETIGMMQ